MSKIVLGLDLGPNSIGWALVNDDPEHPDDAKLIDLGVRVFPEGVDNFDTSKELSRNEDRRIARGMRRQIRRRARRRKLLKQALIDSKLWPSDPSEEAALHDTNPYDLRARALREKLTPHEIGRVLLHLNQRRGFLSNRKKDRGDKEVQGMLAEINALAERMVAENSETIGEHFAKSLAASPLDPVRGHHTHRAMFEHEFETIWSYQAKHHPKLLTEGLKFGKLGKQSYPQKPIARYDERRNGATTLEAFGLYGLIFFQRPMYWPKSVVGLCEFESKEKRCPRADRHAQRFRLLQEVNNLRYSDPDSRGDEAALGDGQRKIVLDFLATHEKATFDQIKKKLGFLESVKFNLERGERSSLKGMVVDCLMAKAAGKSWFDRSDDEKDQIVRLLINNEREDDLIAARLVKEYEFSPAEADAALGVDFPPGYVHLSLKAIDKLLPHLERGLIYQAATDPEKSALHAAGYLRRDELRRRLFDVLPDPSRARAGDLRIGDIPNPVVKRALVELRKVVNAIIREFGKPDAVHLEMARTMQMGKEKRSDMNSEMRKREGQREDAANVLRELGLKVTRDAILRHLLWLEQSHECIYCGKTISQKQLFTGEADVDHILPYSRCLDDSQMNKVVCHRKCNHDKGNRTPYEWLAASPADYDRVCLQAGSLLKRGLLPYRKYRRFLQKELELDKFIARQLTDTGYPDIVDRGGAKAHGEVLEDPWPTFRGDVVQAVKRINVSYRVERKVAGKLHEETLYGPTPVPGEWVLRKPVTSLSPAEVERIRDPQIQRIVIAQLKQHGIEFGRGKKPDAKKMKEALANLEMPSGVPIKKVRLTKPELTIQPIREGQPDQAYVKPGSMHHLCIFECHENGKSKREAVFVTMLEAMNRLKRKEDVIQRSHPTKPDASFVMSLSSRELVLAKWKDGERLLVFKTAASTQGQIYFAEHLDARRSSDQAKFVATANSLDARKVTIDPLGRIRWAND